MACLKKTKGNRLLKKEVLFHTFNLERIFLTGIIKKFNLRLCFIKTNFYSFVKVIHPKVHLQNFIYQVLSEILQNQILFSGYWKNKSITNCHFLFYITQHTKKQKLDFDGKLNISKIFIGH